MPRTGRCAGQATVRAAAWAWFCAGLGTTVGTQAPAANCILSGPAGDCGSRPLGDSILGSLFETAGDSVCELPFGVVCGSGCEFPFGSSCKSLCKLAFRCLCEIRCGTAGESVCGLGCLPRGYPPDGAKCGSRVLCSAGLACYVLQQRRSKGHAGLVWLDTGGICSNLCAHDCVAANRFFCMSD